MSAGHTPGPWDYDQTGDGKRICVGIGLVEGPNGYDVAEVYSDDCDRDEALTNARLIAAAPELLEAAEQAVGHITLMYSGIAHGDAGAGQRFADADPIVCLLRAAIAKATTP